jgi:hypothetical protein
MENGKYAPNGQPQPQRPTTKPGVWSALVNLLPTLLGDLLPPVRLAFALMLIVLLALCAGCATPSAPPTEAARNPQPPQLSEPLPSESYLHKAQKLIESWRNAVTGM